MKIIALLEKATSWVCIVLMAVMATAVIATVFLRYLYGLSYVWMEEIIVQFFIATTFFGAVLGVRRNEHINIPFFLDLMPAGAGVAATVAAKAIAIGVQIVVCLASLHWIDRVGNTLSAGLRIPMAYFYYILPVSAALLAVCELHEIVRICKRRLSPAKETTAGR